MNVSDERLEHARALVLDVLAGVLGPETHAWLLDDDLLLFSVRRVEARDPEWLLAQLADRQIPFDRRVLVFSEMSDHRDRALEILRRESSDFRG